MDVSNASVEAALEWVRALRLRGREAEIARDILPEIRERLKFLREVGLGYLQLGRGATTLSGGEAQRIRLAAQLGSNLSGVLYILDEPTIGLHARDNQQLLAALDALKARGNSLLVVEHDEQTMRRADYIIDLGPGAGVNGGEVVAGGHVAGIDAARKIRHRPLPARTQDLSRARPAAARRVRPEGSGAGSVRGQTAHAEESDGGFSAASFYMLDRGERFGQKHAAARVPVAGGPGQSGQPADAGRRRRGRFQGPKRCGRFMRWINRPSGGRRDRCRRRTSDSSTRSGNCSRKRRRRGCGVTRRAGFPSTARRAAARSAWGRATSSWK